MKHKKRIRRLVIGTALFLVFAGAAMTVVTGYITFQNITRLATNESTGMDNTLEGFEQIGFDYEGFQRQYRIEPVQIPSSLDGHTIPADYIISEKEKADTVLMIHGISANRQSIYPIAELFLQEGYNVLAYDQRSTGENTAPYTTFGYLESHDTADCVSYLDGVLDAEQKVYIYGISFGAATAGISVRHPIVEERVSSMILDSPFSGADEIMRVKMGRMNLGIPLDFMMFCGDLYNRCALGFSYADASAALYLEKSNIPVLIIASKADDFTQFWMAEKLYHASPNATLATVDDSGHAQIFFEHPDWYADTLRGFMK